MATEAYSNLTSTMKYYGTKENPGAHFTFNFETIEALTPQSNAADFKEVIEDWYAALPAGKWSNWVVSTLHYDVFDA